MKTILLTKTAFMGLLVDAGVISEDITEDKVKVFIVWENNTTDPVFDIPADGGAESIRVEVAE